MVDRVVEREQRGLLAAVVGLRGGEAGVHLVGELALAPLRAEGVEVLLELAGDVAEAGRASRTGRRRPTRCRRASPWARPAIVVDVLRHSGIASIDVVGRELVDVAQAHLGAGLLGRRGGPARHGVDGPGRGVVDDRELHGHGLPPGGGRWFSVDGSAYPGPANPANRLARCRACSVRSTARSRTLTFSRWLSSESAANAVVGVVPVPGHQDPLRLVDDRARREGLAEVGDHVAEARVPSIRWNTWPDGERRQLGDLDVDPAERVGLAWSRR